MRSISAMLDNIIIIKIKQSKTGLAADVMQLTIILNLIVLSAVPRESCEIIMLFVKKKKKIISFQFNLFSVFVSVFFINLLLNKYYYYYNYKNQLSQV